MKGSLRIIISFVFLACTVFLFAGCSNKEDVSIEVTSEATPEATIEATAEITSEPTPEFSQAELEQMAYDSLIEGEISRRQEYTFEDITLPQDAFVFEVYEIEFDISADFEGSDKFSMNVCDIVGYFKTPDGSEEAMPAFYKKDDGLRWAIRYNPRQEGEYTFYLKDEINGTITDEYKFYTDKANENRGFIKTEGNKFVDSYGEQFTLFGTNFAWGRVEEFEEALPLYNEHEMNFIRFWSQCDWSAFSLESGSAPAIPQFQDRPSPCGSKYSVHLRPDSFSPPRHPVSRFESRDNS